MSNIYDVHYINVSVFGVFHNKNTKNKDQKDSEFEHVLDSGNFFAKVANGF